MDSLVKALNVEAGGAFVVNAMQVVGWGRTLRFTCVYTLNDETIGFTLVFSDCREIKWRVYVHGAMLTHAAIADFAAGRSQHRSPAHLLTDYFGMSLYYGELVIERDGA